MALRRLTFGLAVFFSSGLGAMPIVFMTVLKVPLRGAGRRARNLLLLHNA